MIGELKECSDLASPQPPPTPHASSHIYPSKTGYGRKGVGVGDKTPDVLSFDCALPCRRILAFVHSSLTLLVFLSPIPFVIQM